MKVSDKIAKAPLVIEAAITPLRKGEPLQSTQQMISEARECLDAGAAIVHHHHDFRMSEEAASEQIITFSKQTLSAYPDAYLYPDYLAGKAIWEKNAHLKAMHAAGALTMMAMDPGHTLFGRIDDRGLPSDSVEGGATYAEADQLVNFANETNTPISLGVYEPGQLRWILAYAEKDMFPAGSYIKLYFGGPYTMGFDKLPGVNFGLHPTRAALDIYLSMMEGSKLPWLVSCQAGVLLDTPLAAYTIEKGGHLRVGIEDTAGGTDMTNRQTVEAVIALAREMGRPIASGAKAQDVLKAGRGDI